MIDGGLFTLPVLIGLAGLLVGGARLALWWWDRKRSQALDQWLIAFTARAKDAALALLRRYKQIEEQPPATGPDLEDKLNDAWKKKP